MKIGIKKRDVACAHPFFIGWNLLSVLMGLNVDELTSLLTGGEYHYAVNEGEQSVVLAHTHVETGMVNGATLTLDDIAGFAIRTTKNFHSESFAF